MKLTRFFAILCLLGAVLTLSAQNTEKAQKWYLYEDWWSPIFCDGEYVNDVIGNLKVHFVVKEMDDEGNILYEVDHVKGTVTDNFGEEFNYKEHQTVMNWENSTGTYTYHLIGDRGTKYRGSLFMDWSDGWGPGLIIIPGKTFCR
jgi:hypothetical protein